MAWHASSDPDKIVAQFSPFNVAALDTALLAAGAVEADESGSGAKHSRRTLCLSPCRSPAG